MVITSNKTIRIYTVVLIRSKLPSFYLSSSCDLCSSHLAYRGGRAVVFRCGHSYHAVPCLSKAGGVAVSDVGEEQWACYKCMIRDNRIVAGDAVKTEEDDVQESRVRPSRFDPTPDQLESIVNRRLAEAKSTADALKTAEPPLATLDRMSSKEFLPSVEFQLASDESAGSVFARRDFALKLWPGPREEDQ